jgi:hypothetical protein
VVKLNRQSWGSTAFRAARVLLGSTLLLSILWANIPSAAIASGPMCTLTCCAGRAPHAAGSCMNSSCHAFLAGHNQTLHVHKTPIQTAEPLCGLSSVRKNVSRLLFTEAVATEPSQDSDSNYSHETSNTDADHASVSTGTLTKPCQPDCGACASGFASSKRQRHAATLGHANRPHPPFGVRLANVDYRPTQKLSALCRRGAPRGPPLPFFA